MFGHTLFCFSSKVWIIRSSINLRQFSADKFSMVIRDLSAPQGAAPQYREEIKIPFATDRFVAAVLDFLIFSPVVSFCVAGFTKQIKTLNLVDYQSFEATIIWALLIFSAFFIVVFSQAAFIYFWQATPGQKFMQMKVISYPRRFEGLSFSQCLLRSTLWGLSFGLLAAPFLEIIGHPLRRAFHERASDTLVITLKEESDPGPLLIERKFVGSWLRMFFLMIFLILGLYGLKTYKLVENGYFANSVDSENKIFCSEIPVDHHSEAKRQDLAIAMYFADLIDSDCLRKEADVALWGRTDTDQAWAYLAKAIASEDKQNQDKYFTKVCDLEKNSEACSISQYLSLDTVDGNSLRKNGLNSLSSKMLLLEDVLEQKNYSSALVLIQDLESEESLQPTLEKLYVKSVWSLKELSLKRTDRMPASSDLDDVFKKFKSKYGVE